MSDQDEFFAILEADPDHGLSAKELRDQLIEGRDAETLNLREQAILSLMTMIQTVSQKLSETYPSFMQQGVLSDMQQGGVQSLKVLGVTRREVAQGAYDLAATHGIDNPTQLAREQEAELARKRGQDVYGVSSEKELGEILAKLFGDR